jgi:hypothetical protein
MNETNEPDALPPKQPREQKSRRRKIGNWSTKALLRVKEKLEDTVRVRALAGLHDSVEHLTDIARNGGARDAPAAARELRALALPERRETQAPPTSAGSTVVQILEALPRLLSSLPGGQAAAPRLLGAVEADYELLDPSSGDPGITRAP